MPLPTAHEQLNIASQRKLTALPIALPAHIGNNPAIMSLALTHHAKAILVKESLL